MEPVELELVTSIVGVVAVFVLGATDVPDPVEVVWVIVTTPVMLSYGCVVLLERESISPV